ncbi:MAG: CBS domain-containing protein [Nitrososphaerales archaeon]|jgi:CBS domain-containing protein
MRVKFTTNQMPKVREVMTKDVPQIDAGASVFEAAKLMNERKANGTIVLQEGKPIGMLTDRALLRRFMKLNKRPEDVTVKQVMAPLLKIGADASVKDAAKKITENGVTRLGVFEKDKLVGWVTITDIARASSKQGIVDSLHRQNQGGTEDELLCPACNSGVMKKVVGSGGVILRWECPNCMHEE